MKWSEIVSIVNNGNPAPPRKVVRSEQEWKERLTAEQYRIMREKGTEKAHSSEMCSAFDPGTYACVGCQTLLFDSTQKFDSGTGWPSFTEPMVKNHVAYFKDVSFGMVRVEVTCNVCDSHLGHVFPDGPSGSMRYCINALSLAKRKTKTKNIDRCGIDRDENPCGDASDY